MPVARGRFRPGCAQKPAACSTFRLAHRLAECVQQYFPKWLLAISRTLKNEFAERFSLRERDDKESDEW